jgi:hypothetical protein
MHLSPKIITLFLNIIELLGMIYGSRLYQFIVGLKLTDFCRKNGIELCMSICTHHILREVGWNASWVKRTQPEIHSRGTPLAFSPTSASCPWYKCFLSMCIFRLSLKICWHPSLFLKRALATKKSTSPGRSDVFLTHPMVKVILWRFFCAKLASGVPQKILKTWPTAHWSEHSTLVWSNNIRMTADGRN